MREPIDGPQLHRVSRVPGRAGCNEASADGARQQRHGSGAVVAAAGPGQSSTPARCTGRPDRRELADAPVAGHVGKRWRTPGAARNLPGRPSRVGRCWATCGDAHPRCAWPRGGAVFGLSAFRLLVVELWRTVSLRHDAQRREAHLCASRSNRRARPKRGGLRRLRMVEPSKDSRRSRSAADVVERNGHRQEGATGSGDLHGTASMDK